MTIEQKALELVNAVERQRDVPLTLEIERREYRMHEALCRAIEAHELDKSRHAAEMREQAERFSEAAGKATAHLRKTVFEWGSPMQGEREETIRTLSPFILAPVDPLAEVADALHVHRISLEQALDARGLAIVKKEAV